MKGLEVIGVGEVIEALVGSSEGMSVVYNPTGLLIPITFTRPTEQEVNTLNTTDIRVSFTVVEGIPFVSIKSGLGANWYNAPVVCNGEFSRQHVEEGNGMIVTIVLVDNITGVVSAIRTFTLSTKLSNLIIDGVQANRHQHYMSKPLMMKLQQIYFKYTPYEMATLCNDIYKVGTADKNVKQFPRG